MRYAFLALLLLVVALLWQAWIPAIGQKLDPDIAAVVTSYFDAAKRKDVDATLHWMVPDSRASWETVVRSGTLERLEPFYAASAIHINDRYYVLPKSLGKSVWLEGYAEYDDLSMWDFDILMAQTAEGWRIFALYPAKTKRRPE